MARRFADIGSLIGQQRAGWIKTMKNATMTDTSDILGVKVRGDEGAHANLFLREKRFKEITGNSLRCFCCTC
jgi:hypothetical protein